MSEPSEHISVTGAGSTFAPFGQQMTGATGPNGGQGASRSGAPGQAANGFGQAFARADAQNGNGSNAPADSLHLSPEAEQQLRKLQQRDAEVRAHEAAHLAAAGQYASGGPKFEYQQGPDGKQYAIGGHVDIDVSPVPGNPEETERKAQQIHRAAMAPGAPSAQDSKVAASAAQMATEAKVDKQEEDREERAEQAEKAEGTATASAAAPTSATAATTATSGVQPTTDATQSPQRAQGHTDPGMVRGLQAYNNTARQGLIPWGAIPQGGLSLII